MNKILLFTDASVNTKTKIGYGAYLILSDFDSSIEVIRPLVRVKRFEQTSSTKLELQTLLWAINENDVLNRNIVIYTDSQNIFGLPGRRERLTKNDFYTKKNTLINNHELYKAFYKLTDLLDFEIIKVSGHMALKQKEYIDEVFTIVDRAARKALRLEKS